MLTFLFCFATYIVGSFLFCLYDAFIGFTCGFKDDLRYGPTVPFAAFFWPIALPYVFCIEFYNLCLKIKERRLDKEKEQEKIRIAAQKEFEKTLEELEGEFGEVVKPKKRKTR